MNLRGKSEMGSDGKMPEQIETYCVKACTFGHLKKGSVNLDNDWLWNIIKTNIIGACWI